MYGCKEACETCRSSKLVSKMTKRNFEGPGEKARGSGSAGSEDQQITCD